MAKSIPTFSLRSWAKGLYKYGSLLKGRRAVKSVRRFFRERRRRGVNLVHASRISNVVERPKTTVSVRMGVCRIHHASCHAHSE